MAKEVHSSRRIGIYLFRIFAGFVITLVAIEAFLRLSSVGIVWLQNRSNAERDNAAGARLTIVTTGESTTADVMARDGRSWPRLLKEELDKQGIAVKVVNLAIPAESTSEQLLSVTKTIELHRPSIVVSMWGINDTTRLWINPGWHPAHQDQHFLSELKVVRLFHSAMAASNQATREAALAEEVRNVKALRKDPAINEMAAKVRAGDLSLTSLIDKVANERNEKDRAKFYYLMGHVALPSYGSKSSSYQGAHQLFQKSFELELYSSRQAEFLGFTSWIQRIDCSGMIPKLEKSSVKPSSILLHRLDNCVEHTPEKRQMFENYARRMFPEYDVANDAVEKPTASNYRNLADAVIGHGACLVAMQYPTLSTDELKAYFHGSPSEADIHFVSNEENFNRVLADVPYDDIFYDNFAKSFGHATARGNAMIVENLLPVIKRLIESGECVRK